jgi:uncharacterized protein
VARIIEIEVFLSVEEPETSLRERVSTLLGLEPQTLNLAVRRKSLDARKLHTLGFRYLVACSTEPLEPSVPVGWPAAPRREDLRVAIVGSGPAGSFAALRLCEAGARVTVVEQGHPVPGRRRDVAALLREGRLDPSSNYCFGEGGAGTFSDGKLHTRTRDRGAVRLVMETLVGLGADAEILVDARPHLGSNRLPRVLRSLRERLEGQGCTYVWSDAAVGLRMERGRVRGVRLRSGADLEADAVVLAAGHSARPLYEALASAGVALAPKPFAVGLRIEHPQRLLDEIQYGRAAGHPRLPPSSYRVSAQVGDRGVYSFCMCPGGFIVPAATEEGGLCTNGMSRSGRDAPLGNAAIVVTVRPEDCGEGPLAGVGFQRTLERAAFAQGGGGQKAPAQRAVDFVRGRASDRLPSASYRPGVTAADLAAVLPGFVCDALREGLGAIDRTMHGFLSAEALLVGVETRTSAPLRTLRDAETFESLTHPGLYPAGEGAGHAGGIVSSAIDGVRVGTAVLRHAPASASA